MPSLEERMKPRGCREVDEQLTRIEAKLAGLVAHAAASRDPRAAAVLPSLLSSGRVSEPRA